MERVVVVGLGRMFQKFILEDNSNKYQIVAFSDNDINKIGRSIQGIPTILPKDIIKLEYDSVLVTTIYYEEISVQLQSYGISEALIKKYEIDETEDDNHLKQLAYEKMINMSEKRPLDINIETVAYCPMKCTFCCNRLYAREKEVMDNSLFEKIVSEYISLWGGGTISIGSMQSDFLSDPLLLQRLHILNKYKSKLYLYSTTPLVSMAKYSDEDALYILSCFDYFQVSVEGYDEETYLRMGGIDGFKTFKEQLLRTKRIIDENKLKIEIELSFRTQDFLRTIDSEFFMLCQKLFAINEVRTTFFSWFGSIKESDMPIGAELVIQDNTDKKTDCVVPYATLSARPNGNVVGCSCIDWLEKTVVGNCKEQTLEEIWLGEKNKKFKAGFSTGHIPSLCRECALYLNVENAFSRSNLLNYESQDGLYYRQ